jgi:hypothetical protein
MERGMLVYFIVVCHAGIVMLVPVELCGSTCIMGPTGMEKLSAIIKVHSNIYCTSSKSLLSALQAANSGDTGVERRLCVVLAWSSLHGECLWWCEYLRSCKQKSYSFQLRLSHFVHQPALSCLGMRLDSGKCVWWWIFCLEKKSDLIMSGSAYPHPRSQSRP